MVSLGGVSMLLWTGYIKVYWVYYGECHRNLCCSSTNYSFNCFFPTAWTFGSKCDTELELCSGCAKTESHYIFKISHCEYVWYIILIKVIAGSLQMHATQSEVLVDCMIFSAHGMCQFRAENPQWNNMCQKLQKKKTHGCTHIVYIFTLSHITKPHSSAVSTGSPNGLTYFLISFWQDPLGAQIGIALVADTNNPHSVPLRLAEAPGDGELNMKFLREKFAEFRAFRSPINQDVNCLLEVAVCCWNLRAPSCA